MYDNATASALADARTHAMARAGYDDGPPDPDVQIRESISALSPVAPSALTAAALLSSAAVQPVPVNRESLEPTGEPLTDLAAVDAHWRANLSDGVGVRAGVQVNGSTIFGVRGTVAALRGWLADVGGESNEIRNEHGTVLSSTRTYRPTTPFVQIRWSAPPPVPGRSVVSFGAELLDASRMLHGSRQEDARALEAMSWLAWSTACVWSVAPTADTPGQGLRRLVVRSHTAAKGVQVVGAGDLVPWHVLRGNGWTLAAGNMPIAGDEPLSQWIVNAAGASWKAVR